jgi:3-methylcrotonyl-CoA carboxylase alpha subunit
MFTKILIANRGEIACRIIKTAQRMSIRCVAIYSEADADALHVKLADEAYCVGPAPTKESYLCGDKIIAIAQQSGAQAIHPGYGFLSENAAFAEQCAKAKICFIGPPASAIAAMGSKSKAKQLMEKAKVPLLPGYHGDDQSLEKLQAEAEKIGYPVLLKAAAGGGGKGMRVVNQAQSFAAALDAAKREAKSSFGDDKILIEKYLLKPRHIEIQVFADSKGNAVYLFERDCSIQRRHQKIIEEAPAPFMKAKLREQMGQAAVTCAKTIGYIGAGTVEFLVDEDGSFYFMEMNTRLQVEHPVTEFITQQDLVEWQLRVADGEKLPLTQKELAIHGHAIEVRLYAEDPHNDFLPAVGKIDYLKTPTENSCVRIDSGIIEGDHISPYYDPMITKLIVWGEDRAAAILHLQQALADYQIIGVTTNLDLLAAIAHHPAFIKGKFDTAFIQQYHADLMQTPAIPAEVLVLASTYILETQNYSAEENRLQSFDPFSPWNNLDQWRLNLPAQQKLKFNLQQNEQTVFFTRNVQHDLMVINAEKFIISDIALHDDEISMNINQQHCKANIFAKNNHLYILYHGRRYQLLFLDHTQLNASDTKETKSTLTSPMPGKVIALLAKTGDQVAQGEGLAIVEAMKMEHTIHAPQTGTVKEWYFQVGDIVDEGVELLKFETT